MATLVIYSDDCNKQSHQHFLILQRVIFMLMQLIKISCLQRESEVEFRKMRKITLKNLVDNTYKFNFNEFIMSTIIKITKLIVKIKNGCLALKVFKNSIW